MERKMEMENCGKQRTYLAAALIVENLSIVMRAMSVPH
jgi:hypothetical protein